MCDKGDKRGYGYMTEREKKRGGDGETQHVDGYTN